MKRYENITGQKIVTLTKEIDFAIKRDSNIKVQQEDDRKNILEL